MFTALNQRKKSTNSDSGVMTCTHSMDYAILESSDEHKPMEICDVTTGQSKKTHDQKEISAPSLHGSGIIHQNINYARNRGGGNKNNSDGYSVPGVKTASSTLTQMKSSEANSSHERRTKPIAEMFEIPQVENKSTSVTSNVPKPQQEVFATPCQKG